MIKRSVRWRPSEKAGKLEFREDETETPEIFNENAGIASFAGYVSPSQDTTIDVSISAKVNDSIYGIDDSFTAEAGEWTPIGLHNKVPLDNVDEFFADLQGKISVTSDTVPEWVDFFGTNLSSIVWEDYMENIEYDDGSSIQDKFGQRTSSTVPYLYYLNHEIPFLSDPVSSGSISFDEGQHTVLKSCNRCGRFLPVEYVPEKERNLTSFGNHCVSRAPCDHGSFGSLKVIREDSDLNDISQNLNQVLAHDGDDLLVDLHYGYQLECKACKKFYVNAALNPMRNSTQHREDSLRRRAIEVLVRKLLDDDWIYHRFRQDRDEEFDKHIWENFDKECFKCNTELRTPSEMDLDHTMPLAALWPLDNHATCLCSDCNSEKSDQFPIDFYTEDELRELSHITGIDPATLRSRSINMEAVRELQNQIVWFFDDFLAENKYQKDRAGKIVADLIVRSIQSRIDNSDIELNLVSEYRNQASGTPNTITTHD